MMKIKPPLGRVAPPKQMNFRESSKWPLTTSPCPLEWPLSLEIMCMYFILSGPHTYIYATICGAVNFWRLFIQFKKLQHNFPKMMGGGQRQFGFFSENLSILVPWPVPVSIWKQQLHKKWKYLLFHKWYWLQFSFHTDHKIVVSCFPKDLHPTASF